MEIIYIQIWIYNNGKYKKNKYTKTRRKYKKK